MKNLRAAFLGAVLVAAGCGGGETGDDTGGSTSGGDTSGGGTSSGSTSGASGSTSSSPTTGEATGSSGGTTGSGVEYCNGFDVAADEPFLEVRTQGGVPIGDGVTWPLECGGQGSWMFGLYPSLGGWDPGMDTVIFSITVDVEGFNTNPDGHFYSNTMEYYYVGCEILDGGVVGVLGVLPPDGIADLSLLDGKTATVHVEITGGGQLIGADAVMTLSAPADLVMQGCMFL